MVIGVGTTRGAQTGALGELVASFDAERQALGVPSISVALVEDGRVSLVQRGVRSASTGAPVGPETRYQAASMSKTVAASAASAADGASRFLATAGRFADRGACQAEGNLSRGFRSSHRQRLLMHENAADRFRAMMRAS